MELFLNPSDVAEVIGVDEEIIKQTLNQKHPEIEPFLRTVSAPAEEEDARPKAILQLRIDGLAPLITQLSYNIPTNDIIENLICQVVHIAYLRENNEKLENEIAELQEKVKSLQEERADLRVQINNLQEEKPKTWKNRFFKLGD
jgi:predicted RNase H-like nuclease (RuvC/YqgF family)